MSFAAIEMFHFAQNDFPTPSSAFAAISDSIQSSLKAMEFNNNIEDHDGEK